MIHTDEWKAYSSIGRKGYSHSTITHKYYFVDPLTGVHTQHVESFNNKIKTNIKNQKGVIKDVRPRFLTFFIFVDTYKSYALEKLLEVIKVN